MNWQWQAKFKRYQRQSCQNVILYWSILCSGLLKKFYLEQSNGVTVKTVKTENRAGHAHWLKKKKSFNCIQSAPRLNWSTVWKRNIVMSANPTAILRHFWLYQKWTVTLLQQSTRNVFFLHFYIFNTYHYSRVVISVELNMSTTLYIAKLSKLSLYTSWYIDQCLSSLDTLYKPRKRTQKLSN